MPEPIRCCFCCVREPIPDLPGLDFDFEKELYLHHVPRVGDNVTFPGFEDGATGTVKIVDWDFSENEHYVWLYVVGDKMSGHPTGEKLETANA